MKKRFDYRTENIIILIVILIIYLLYIHLILIDVIH
jgi:hypothetical protein